MEIPGDFTLFLNLLRGNTCAAPAQSIAVPAQGYRKIPSGWIVALDRAIVYPTMQCILSHNSVADSKNGGHICETIPGFDGNQTNFELDSSLLNVIQ